MNLDPSNNQQYRADASATGQPGYHTAFSDTTAMRDSITALIDGLSSSYFPSFAKAYFVSVGNVAPGSHELIGATTVQVGQANTYRMRTQWDTIGYTYQWIVDGTASTATGAQTVLSFGTLDTHIIRSIAITTSGTPDTVATSVFVPFTVTINGPSSYDVSSGGTWSVAIPAGTAPYTYAWYVDDEPTGVTSATYYGGISETMGSHVLRVDVHDSAGHSAIARKTVSVSGANCDPGVIFCE